MSKGIGPTERCKRHNDDRSVDVKPERYELSGSVRFFLVRGKNLLCYDTIMQGNNLRGFWIHQSSMELYRIELN